MKIKALIVVIIIVYASRIPPRPLGDWRLGGWEAGSSTKKVNKFDERVHEKDNVAIAVCLKIDFKHRPKILPKWSLGTPWGCPGTSPGARSSPVFRQNEASKTNWKASGRLPGRPVRPPGIQGGPKNRRKIDFWRNKRLPEPFFCVSVLYSLLFFTNRRSLRCSY